MSTIVVPDRRVDGTFAGHVVEVSAAAVTPETLRGRGDRGSGMVAGITLMFAFTFVGLVWLARDVDRGVSNQSAAQSIAFQAARAGAQAAQVDELRDGDFGTFDESKVIAAANGIAQRLFASYDVNGTVIKVDQVDGKVTVIVQIVDGSKTVKGVGTVRTASVVTVRRFVFPFSALITH